MSSPLNLDRARQVFITFSAAAAGIGALVGSGVLGTPVRDSAHGALAADATLLAPGQGAFSIWSLIYLGFVVYTVWQWLPRNTASARERAVGWWAGTSMLLSAAWILTSQVDALTAGFVIMVVLSGVLITTVAALNRHPAASVGGLLIVDGTFGLYLGWIAAATFANLAAVNETAEWSPLHHAGEGLAIGMVVAVTALSLVLVASLSARLAVSLGLIWGLLWVAVARFTDQPYSPPVATAAVLAAATVLAGTAVARAVLTRRAAATG